MFHLTAAFFASRDIARGEELTFDYDPNKSKRWALKTRGDPGGQAMPCQCGASRCRRVV